MQTPASAGAITTRMGRRVTRPSDDPLMQGGTVKQTFTLPTALSEHLREIALDDRFVSLSEYVSHLLLFAVRAREAEKLALEKPKKAPKK